MEFNSRIKSLAEYKYKDFPVTSLYLRLGPQDRQNQKYKLTAKNLIKDLRKSLGKRGLTKSSLESIESDFLKLTGYVENLTDISECRGLAVFSSSGQDYWEVFKLPDVYRNQLVVDRTPLLGQLIKIDDEYSDIVTVLVDRKKARIFRLDTGGEREILDYFYPAASRTRKFSSSEGTFKQRVSQGEGAGSMTQSYGEHSFQRTIENEVHQHYKYTSDKVFEYYKEHKFKWLIVGGTEKNISEFTEHLHSYLGGILAGTIRADVDKIKPYQVMEAALEPLQSKKTEEQHKLLSEFEEKQAKGLAVDGVDSTLSALSKGQLRVLLVEEDFSVPGFVCPETGMLLTEQKKELCPEDVEPFYVVDVADLAIEEAFRQKAETEIVHGEESKKRISGIAGILRFKV